MISVLVFHKMKIGLNNMASNKRDCFNEINITPLTDIFLVLLIIMMVIAPLLDNQGLNLTVPEIVKQENIKVEESDFEAKVEELAKNMKKKPAEIKKTMNPNQREVIENNIISEKVINLLKEKNNIK